MNEIMTAVLTSTAMTSMIWMLIGSTFKKGIDGTIDNSFKEQFREFEEELKLKYKYNNMQFDIYSEIWSNLMEIDIIIDKLWKNKIEKNPSISKSLLHDMKRKLEIAQNNILKKSLFISEKHLRGLKDLFPRGEEYIHGKNKLLRIRMESTNISNEDERQIEINRSSMGQWKALMNEIEKDFRKKLVEG